MKTKSTLTQRLEKLLTIEKEKKHEDAFAKQASYVGNGIYRANNRYSTNTRELFLMFACDMEEIAFKVD